MVKGGLIKGMTSQAKNAPPKCESCIVGKQTKTMIPKIRGGGDGNWSTRKLGKVWVDLNGPHAVESCTGNRYIMNIVDDYTSYPWSIPLKTKNEAFQRLMVWEHEQENETGLKVGIYCTDNRELKTNEMLE